MDHRRNDVHIVVHQKHHQFSGHPFLVHLGSVEVWRNDHLGIVTWAADQLEVIGRCYMVSGNQLWSVVACNRDKHQDGIDGQWNSSSCSCSSDKTALWHERAWQCESELCIMTQFQVLHQSATKWYCRSSQRDQHGLKHRTFWDFNSWDQREDDDLASMFRRQ